MTLLILGLLICLLPLVLRNFAFSSEGDLVDKQKEQKLIELMRHFESCELEQDSTFPNQYHGRTQFGKITINVSPDQWYADIWYCGVRTVYRELEATKFINLFI